jgi:hypothetical protein
MAFKDLPKTGTQWQSSRSTLFDEVNDPNQDFLTKLQSK